MEGKNRLAVRPGARVRVVQKQDQGSGRLTEGVVADVLTKSMGLWPIGLNLVVLMASMRAASTYLRAGCPDSAASS